MIKELEASNMHNNCKCHSTCCEHKNVKYCPICRVCYCLDCGHEWGNMYYSTNTYTIPYVTPYTYPESYPGACYTIATYNTTTAKEEKTCEHHLM